MLFQNLLILSFPLNFRNSTSVLIMRGSKGGKGKNRDERDAFSVLNLKSVKV